uniref:Peptidase_M13 domain-containing protein n=1 Tax=Meloidogyne floridensis TaxID=298350 RepID=A0A915P6X2_9BILA
MFEFHHSCMSWSGKELFGSNAVLNKLELLHTDGKMKRPQFNTEWGIKAFPVGGFFQLVTIFDTRKGRTNLERKIVGVRPMSLISSQSDWNSNGNGNKLMATRFGQIINSLLEDDIVRSHQYNVNPVLFPFSNYILKGEIPLSCSKTKCPMSERLKQMVKSEAERRVKNLLLVEQMLAQHFDTDPLYENDPLSHQNYIQLSQLDKPGEFLHSFNWTNYLRSILSPINYKINWRTEIYVSEVGLLQRLAKTIEKLTDQQIADYLDWQILWTFLPQLDTRYTHPYVDVNKMKDSFSVKKCPMDRRWMKMGEKCKKFIEWYFPHFLDHLYVKKYLAKGVKEQVKQIFTDIYAAFKQMLETNSWLDLKAKQNALIKLKGIRSVSAYFDQIFNDNYLQQIYRPFYLLKTDALFPQIVYQLTGLSLLRQMATLDYYDPSWGVNAYYSRENNALVTLNAYLQPPVFNHDFPAPFNYAGIGVTLGHELTHAFDAWGSYYDAEGKYNNDWLLPDIRRKFQERKQCFVKQYGDIKVQVDGTLLSINGSLTANENIADNGGLIAAFNAFQLLKQKVNYPKHVFNGLRQYNDEQLFFIHYAY